jgi:hypothetical protein
MELGYLANCAWKVTRQLDVTQLNTFHLRYTGLMGRIGTVEKPSKYYPQLFRALWKFIWLLLSYNATRSFFRRCPIVVHNDDLISQQFTFFTDIGSNKKRQGKRRSPVSIYFHIWPLLFNTYFAPKNRVLQFETFVASFNAGEGVW